MDAPAGADGLRLTDLVAAISLATDLGTGSRSSTRGELLRAVVHGVGAGQPVPRRVQLLVEALSDPGGRSSIAHCEVGSRPGSG